MNSRTRAAPKPSGRMSLKNIRSAKKDAPDRIFVMGLEGVGKSTFGSDSPAPIFLSSEDGIRMFDVPAFTEPEHWVDVLDGLHQLASGEHEYKTLVVDTVDWLEPLVWKHVCQMNGWQSIDDPGYGKGFAVALEQWRRFIVGLERVRAKGVTIVLLAHTSVKSHFDPRQDHDYSRWQCKLHRGASALLREWCDVCMFAAYEEWTHKERGQSRAKAAGSGRRVLYTQHTTAYDAKSRFELPDTLDLSWAAYAAARKDSGKSQVPALKAQVADLIGLLAGDDAEKKSVLDGYAAKAGENPVLLDKLINRLRGKVAERDKGGE